MSSAKILFVDDEEKILNAIERQLEDSFDIVTALGPKEALEILEDEGPFAVVVSDMRMPEMNGIELLKHVRERSPNTVRMILSGFADLNATILAVNEGNIFRFLAKPCPEKSLAAALRAGLNQYSLIEAEKELVEGTLRGSVKILTDILSLVSPLAFGQSTRVRNTVDGILSRVTIPDHWTLELAAMLAALGSVTLPQELVERKLNRDSLDTDEENAYRDQYTLTGSLLQNIPRMDEVAQIIGALNGQESELTGDINRKVQVLELAFDFDVCESASDDGPLQALAVFKEKHTRYDGDLLAALDEYVKEERNSITKLIDIDELRVGMLLGADVLNDNGVLMLSKGHEVTESALRLLANLSKNHSVPSTLCVLGEPEDEPIAV